jgi:hypothetical protein
MGEFDGAGTPGKNEVMKAALVSIMLKAAFLFVQELSESRFREYHQFFSHLN